MPICQHIVLIRCAMNSAACMPADRKPTLHSQAVMQVGVKREEALSILASEGMLLVLCSLIDNMPYVVAEAAVRSSGWHACMYSHAVRLSSDV